MRDATSCSGVALETTPGAAPAGTGSSGASAATSACNAIDGHLGDRVLGGSRFDTGDMDAGDHPEPRSSAVTDNGCFGG